MRQIFCEMSCLHLQGTAVSIRRTISRRQQTFLVTTLTTSNLAKINLCLKPAKNNSSINIPSLRERGLKSSKEINFSYRNGSQFFKGASRTRMCRLFCLNQMTPPNLKRGSSVNILCSAVPDAFFIINIEHINYKHLRRHT